MPFAIRITDENVEKLIDWGKLVQMNLDHLRWEVEPEFPELGPNYLITDGRRQTDNVTCTTMTRTDFLRNWKFVEDEEIPPTHFSRIEKV